MATSSLAGMKLKWVYVGGSPPNSEKFPVLQGKNASTMTSAGQRTGPRTIGELLLLEKRKKKCHRLKMFAGQPLTPPKNLVMLHSYSLVFN